MWRVLPYQFMGREADTAGLYYYRARYYSPQLPGFISEDPIGFAGGQLSFYAAFGGDPLDYIDPSGLAGITVVHQVPPDAVMYQLPNNETFYAPPSADFLNEYQAGQATGMFNPSATNAAIGQFGTYDYQRQIGPNGPEFVPAYTNASNFGVGVFMNGAGFSEAETTAIGNTYAFFKSSNSGSAQLTKWWQYGWEAAQQKRLMTSHLCR
jgi:RHS repeat-associated protein